MKKYIGLQSCRPENYTSGCRYDVGLGQYICYISYGAGGVSIYAPSPHCAQIWQLHTFFLHRTLSFDITTGLLPWIRHCRICTQPRSITGTGYSLQVQSVPGCARERVGRMRERMWMSPPCGSRIRCVGGETTGRTCCTLVYFEKKKTIL